MSQINIKCSVCGYDLGSFAVKGSRRITLPVNPVCLCIKQLKIALMGKNETEGNRKDGESEDEK